MSTPTRETLAARLREQAQAHDDSVRAGDTGRIAEYHRESAVLSRQAADALAATCAWTLDDFDGWWNTACGRAHEFTTGGPVDNAQPFCGYCGGRLVVTAHPGADTRTEREG